jgi:hypothetical protein
VDFSTLDLRYGQDKTRLTVYGRSDAEPWTVILDFIGDTANEPIEFLYTLEAMEDGEERADEYMGPPRAPARSRLKATGPIIDKFSNLHGLKCRPLQVRIRKSSHRKIVHLNELGFSLSNYVELSSRSTIPELETGVCAVVGVGP